MRKRRFKDEEKKNGECNKKWLKSRNKEKFEETKKKKKKQKQNKGAEKK